MNPSHVRHAVVLLAALLAAALACSDSGNKIEEHQSRGDAYLEEGQTSEAILEFKNVLQIDPNSADAHYGLARAYVAGKQMRQAYWELQETVRLDPTNLDAKVQYLRDWVAHPQFDDYWARSSLRG